VKKNKKMLIIISIIVLIPLLLFFVNVEFDFVNVNFVYDKAVDYVSLSFKEANEINSVEDLQKFLINPK